MPAGIQAPHPAADSGESMNKRAQKNRITRIRGSALYHRLLSMPGDAPPLPAQKQDAFSSLIQTILLVPDFHRISRSRGCGSRTVPPVGNHTLPRRIFILLTLHSLIHFFREIKGILNFFPVSCFFAFSVLPSFCTAARRPVCQGDALYITFQLSQ